MRVVLISIGTDGDILPFVGVGVVLRERGHSVTLAASAHYEPLATAHGFTFRALVSVQEQHELIANPDFWHPLKTAPLSARWGVRFLRRQYELLAPLATREALFLASPAIFAASLAHETHGVPLANLVLQPWLIPSSLAPPIMPGFTWLARAPRPVWQVFWRGLDVVAYILAGRELNRFRRTLGLPPQRRIIHNWLSRQLVIGMFPDWYGPPQADWPPQLQLAGFPQFDGAPSNALAPEVLQFCQAGQPPVAFTFGTGMVHSADLFQAALEACEILRGRGIFLTKYRDQLPRSLPPAILACEFAPFLRLFPLCAAVVHHGGIGTVAKALAAGVPQLIQPICFDQVDNGARVKRLGAGDCLPSRRSTGNQIAAALSALLTEEARTRCRDLKKRYDHTDALTVAADRVEKLAAAQGRLV